ncbi:S1 RNA-binding domain-containing protein [bacterium]|nr:S1 RNA-binding domain-containing protein [bacterium]
MAIEIGSTQKGLVLKVAEYGAIVRLPEGSTGLVHISEIANTYVRDIRDYISEGDDIKVKVLRIGPKGRFELSIKQCDPNVVSPQSKPTIPVAAGVGASFEDRLSKFLKDSEERMHDIKRRNESKRGRK